RGANPPGPAFGGGFPVVNTMTSLTGASGEDFASILRSLGYRMERRPKPPEPPPVPVSATPQADAAGAADVRAESAAAVNAQPDIADVPEVDPAPAEAIPAAIGEESSEEPPQPVV